MYPGGSLNRSVQICVQLFVHRNDQSLVSSSSSVSAESAPGAARNDGCHTRSRATRTRGRTGNPRADTRSQAQPNTRSCRGPFEATTTANVSSESRANGLSESRDGGTSELRDGGLSESSSCGERDDQREAQMACGVANTPVPRFLSQLVPSNSVRTPQSRLTLTQLEDPHDQSVIATTFGFGFGFGFRFGFRFGFGSSSGVWRVSDFGFRFGLVWFHRVVCRVFVNVPMPWILLENVEVAKHHLVVRASLHAVKCSFSAWCNFLGCQVVRLSGLLVH